ncbi:hypothetical protein [Nocardiopsis sp. YSL2]|uniref:hypothetical protein n=1 Tax=Nocardiopsis sp. YSL2 TaxID=2939492 RepID=UPI0026F46AA7|nr:hypothetical protein [Nocardiopsis sp. YSL2]
MNRITTASLGVAAALVVSVPFTLAVTTSEESPREPMPLMAATSDIKPNSSVRDWVTYADHVVQVRVAEEEHLPADPVAIERGEGAMGRRVTLDVQRVLWSSEDAPRPAPDSYEIGTWGSSFTDGNIDDPVPTAAQGHARVEVGHTYIKAIFWEAERCSEGDGRQPAMWLTLGGGATIPADNGVIGNGEFEGRVMDADERGRSARFADEGPNPTVQGRMMGQNVGQLAQALRTADPDPNPGDYDLPPAPCE